MKAYGLYVLSNDKTQWVYVLISKYYHSVLHRVNELTYAGKKCMIVCDEQEKLKYFIPANNNENPILEIDCAD